MSFRGKRWNISFDQNFTSFLLKKYLSFCWYFLLLWKTINEGQAFKEQKLFEELSCRHPKTFLMLSRNGTNFFLLTNQKCVFSKIRNLLKTIKKFVSKSIAELLKDNSLELVDITLRIVRMFSVSTNCFQEAKTYSWTHLCNYLLISRKNFIWILDILSRLSFGNNFGYKFDLKKRISPCWYRPNFWKKKKFFLCYLPSKLLVWQMNWHLCKSGWWGRNRKT